MANCTTEEAEAARAWLVEALRKIPGVVSVESRIEVTIEMQTTIEWLGESEKEEEIEYQIYETDGEIYDRFPGVLISNHVVRAREEEAERE